MHTKSIFFALLILGWNLSAQNGLANTDNITDSSATYTYVIGAAGQAPTTLRSS